VALRYVVLVLILSAAALAFVVLFSLTSINIDERNRELATIKVLGFYNSELASYIYRENMILTVLSSLIGIVLGIFMQRYVILTAEVDLVMFSRDILWQTYLYSAGLTIVFAAFVNAIMFTRFKKIDMVSSLKSIE
jgi:putative ABC transport system permease protein